MKTALVFVAIFVSLVAAGITDGSAYRKARAVQIINTGNGNGNIGDNSGNNNANDSPGSPNFGPNFPFPAGVNNASGVNRPGGGHPTARAEAKAEITGSEGTARATATATATASASATATATAYGR